MGPSLWSDALIRRKVGHTDEGEDNASLNPTAVEAKKCVEGADRNCDNRYPRNPAPKLDGAVIGFSSHYAYLSDRRLVA